MSLRDLTTPVIATAATALVLTACGGSDTGEPGGDGEEYTAQLTIIGNSNLMLAPLEERVLQVRYHDTAGSPLAGDVTFRIEGTGGGAVLTTSSQVTDDTGLAEAGLVAGDGDHTFTVTASAPEAAPVSWSVATSPEAARRTASGDYLLDSKFDVLTAMPGEAGQVLSIITAFSDDPGGFLVDQIDNPVLNTLKPVVSLLINQAIEDAAPAFVNEILTLGDHLGDAMTEFGVVSVLKVSEGNDVDDVSYGARHKIDAFRFDIDGNVTTHPLTDLGVTAAAVKNIGIDYKVESGKIEIDAHQLDIPYGGVLALLVDETLVSYIDPTADGLEEMLQNAIDCEQIGENLASDEGLGFGSAGTYEGLCNLGVAATAQLILDRLRQIDDNAPVRLNIRGSAIARDTDNEGHIDELKAGKWLGTIDYDGNVADLPEDANTFLGERM